MYDGMIFGTLVQEATSRGLEHTLHILEGVKLHGLITLEAFRKHLETECLRSSNTHVRNVVVNSRFLGFHPHFSSSRIRSDVL